MANKVQGQIKATFAFVVAEGSDAIARTTLVFASAEYFQKAVTLIRSQAAGLAEVELDEGFMTLINVSKLIYVQPIQSGGGTIYS